MSIKRGIANIVSGILVFLGAGLSHAYLAHAALGTANYPYEGTRNIHHVVVLSVFMGVVIPMITACLHFLRMHLVARFSQAVSVLFAAVALQQSNGLLDVGVPFLLVLSICIQIACLLPSDSQAQTPNYGGLFVTLTLLPVLFQVSIPQSSCFGQVPHTTSLQVLQSTSYDFAECFSIETEYSFVQVRNHCKDRTIFSSQDGFVIGALGGSFIADNEEEAGVYLMEDLPAEFSTLQTVENISLLKNKVILTGSLSFKHGLEPYTLVFQIKNSDQLEFTLDSKGQLSRIYFSFAAPETDEIYGMGIQNTYLNLQGGCVPVFTREQGIFRDIQPFGWIVNLFVKGASGSWQNSYAPVPHYMTSSLNSVYLTSTDFSLFDFSKPGKVTIEVNASSISGAFVIGETPLELLKIYTKYHAGRMRKLPPWVGNGAVLGLQGGTEKVMQYVEILKKANVPIAALWLQDWTGKRETGFGRRLQWNWQINEKHYPGWYDMIRTLAKDHIYVLSYINPYLADTGGISNEPVTLFHVAEKENCLVKDSHGKVQIQASATPDFTYGTVDLSSPRCRKWYIEQVIQKEMMGRDTTSFDSINGVLGWMADFAESISMDVEMEGGQGSKVHNEFPVQWAQTSREAFDMNDFFKENGVFFTRSAGAQSPKHTTLIWMGDQMVTWDHFDGIQSALNGMLSSGMSGFSLGHSDVGGYTMIERGGGAIKFVRSTELFQRWAEMSAFSDCMFRTHEGLLPDPSTQAYDDSVITHFGKMATLHSKLYTVIKSPLMKEAELTGAPVMRHMFLHYPNDPQARNAPHQFMLGPNIIVCPVVTPNTNERLCYVPEGRWRYVYTKNVVSKGYYKCHAPIGQPCVLYLPQGEMVADAIRSVLL